MVDDDELVDEEVEAVLGEAGVLRGDLELVDVLHERVAAILQEEAEVGVVDVQLGLPQDVAARVTPPHDEAAQLGVLAQLLHEILHQESQDAY